MFKIYIKENISSKKILDYALKDYADMDNYELIYNEYGKPYLKDKNIYFNISHSCKITVCVISNTEVGVDIEKIQYRENVVKKVFNPKEKEYLKKIEDKAKAFTKCWTIKESFTKMKGIGLSFGFQNVDSLALKDKANIIEYQDYIISIIFNS